MSLALLTPFVGPILDIVKRVIPDPKERAEIEAKITAAAAETDARVLEAQRDVVVAEASGNGMQRNWRPLFMFVCMGLLVWHAVFLPILAAVLSTPMHQMIGLEHVPDGLWTLLTIGMGGYIAGRSVEKVAKARGGLF